jgi:hypothetical protein
VPIRGQSRQRNSVITNTRNDPLNDVIGVPNRWPSTDWGAPIQPTPKSGLPQQVSILPPDQPVQSGREETAVLIKQGRLFLANRDPTGARVVLERAVQHKDAEAALMLAATMILWSCAN